MMSEEDDANGRFAVLLAWNMISLCYCMADIKKQLIRGVAGNSCGQEKEMGKEIAGG